MPEHTPTAEEYWGEDAIVVEPGSEQKKGAVAPSVAAGLKKFGGIIARDSPNAILEVAFRKPRASVSINRVVVPAGFPSVVEFWRAAKSTRMFAWGLCKWRKIHPDAAWSAPMKGLGFSACSAGRLRRAIVADSTDQPVTDVQRAIVRAVVRHGIVRFAGRGASVAVRLVVNLTRWRKAILRCLFLARLARLARVLVCPDAKRRKMAGARTGRESPSLHLR